MAGTARIRSLARHPVRERLALLAVLLLIAVPPVLGNAALATLDVPAAATTLLALYLGERWLSNETWRNALLFGLATGVAVGTKLSAIPFIGLGVGVLGLLHGLRPFRSRFGPPADRRQWLQAGITRLGAITGAGLVAAAFLALLYGGRFVYLTDHAEHYSETLSFLFGDRGWAHGLAYGFAARVPLPEALRTFVDGLRVLVDSDLAWGQDLRRLEHRLAELKVPAFSFAYLGTADLNRETFPKLTRLPPGQRTTGWVAITALARVQNLAGYAWLDAYTPVETVGKTIDLYFIPDTP